MKSCTQPSNQAGVVTVELAFILPIMLALCFGITELGRALYQYNGLVKATRGAARYLAQYDLANEDATVVRANAIQWAVYGAPTSCSDSKQLVCTYPTTSLVSGLNEAQVTLCDYLTCLNHKSVLTGQGTVDMVSVTIGGTGDKAFGFASLVPYGPGSFKFTAIKTTMASRYF